MKPFRIQHRCAPQFTRFHKPLKNSSSKKRALTRCPGKPESPASPLGPGRPWKQKKWSKSSHSFLCYMTLKGIYNSAVCGWQRD